MRLYRTIIKISSLVLLLASLIWACEPERKELPPWEWDTDSTNITPPKDSTDTPPADSTDTPPADTSVNTLKPRLVWIDACANFPDYANSKENIASDLQKIADCGFTGIVVDVRPSMGDVLFNTTAEQQVQKLDYWSNTGYQYFYRTATWDYLQAFIDAAKEVDLKVYASINTFTGGYLYPYGLGEDGMLFRDASRRDWAEVLNRTGGLMNVMDCEDYSCKFLNPANSEVQDYLLTMLEDLARYQVDGILLDRCRYDDLCADFSELSRSLFEEYIGEKVENFPEDIVGPDTYYAPTPMPKHFKKWLEWRVKIIHDFVEKAADLVHSTNPDIEFGTYVGGWYSSYYPSGVNWASPSYNTSAHYSWATPEYSDYGYADHLDLILIGAYASASSIYGMDEWTTQGFCIRAGQVLMGAVPYYGGPDVGNWDTSGCSDISAAVTNTVDACINNSDGYFVFDLIHIKMYDYWDEIKAGIDKYIKANT